MKVYYTSEILDTGDAVPLFRVTMDDDPEVYFEADSPILVWNLVGRRVAELRGQTTRKIGLPEYFGLSSSIICYLIQQMEGADKCVNYVMRPFGPPRVKARKLNPSKPAHLSTSVIAKETSLRDLLPAPTITYDDNGTRTLPIHLSSTTIIIELGHIVTDRPGFHTASFIYPAGFKSSRLYWSTIDPSMRVRYTSAILDTGGETPLFRVTMDDHPEVSFEGNTPSSPWNFIAKMVSVAHGRGNRGLRISGPETFGLKSPVICYLIQQMDGAEKCVNYVMQPFEPRHM
jgi:hypothetical protein